MKCQKKILLTGHHVLQLCSLFGTSCGLSWRNFHFIYQCLCLSFCHAFICSSFIFLRNILFCSFILCYGSMMLLQWCSFMSIILIVLPRVNAISKVYVPRDLLQFHHKQPFRVFFFFFALQNHV